MLDVNIIDASAELRLLRFLEDYTPPFDVMGTYRLIDDGVRPEATVTLRAGEQEMHEADLGVGPVDALANVLKKSLGQLFPDIPRVRLLDFKVRLIEGHIGTASQIEVSIIFSDGRKLWKVSSVDDNVNLASFQALLEGYEYAIYIWGREADTPLKRGGGETGKRGKTAIKPGTAAKAKAAGKAKPKGKAVAAAPKRGKEKVQSPGSRVQRKAAAPKAKPKAKATTATSKRGTGETAKRGKTATKPKAKPKK